MAKKNNTSQVERKRRQDKTLQAIAMVNDVLKTRIAPSEVHGVGVFAIRDIKKGEIVYASAMPQMLDITYNRFTFLQGEVREIILEHFPRVVDGSQFMVPDTLPQLYMNHANNKKDLNYDNKTDKATRKIRKGEEIFEDYKAIKGWEKIHKWLVVG